jgi:hypothetical protein
MNERRRERTRVQRLGMLLRALELAEAGGLETLSPESLARAEGFPVRSLSPDPEDLFFPDEVDLRTGFGEVLGEAGLLEAALAWARHLQEDEALWRRRLALVAQEPRLGQRRRRLDEAWRALLEDHFRRWGAAGPAGERQAGVEADLVLAALRGAERRWCEGGGRPVLPVLAQEALALLWPALYAHARKAKFD